MMWAIFDYDQSFVKARRGVLISSVTSVLIGSQNFLNGNMEIFNLQIEFSQEHLIGTARAATLYFLYIFLWLSITEYFKPTTNKILNLYRNSTLRLRSIADNEDNREMSNYEGFPDADPEGFPAGTLAAYAAARKEERVKSNIEIFEASLRFARVFFVDFLPPILIGAFSLIYPNEIFSIIYHDIGS